MLELIAAVPLLLLAGLLAWQLAAILIAGQRATEEARAQALRASGRSGTVVSVQHTVTVPRVLPGVDGLTVTARAAVRAR